MRRHEFLTLLGDATLVWPLIAGAQKSAELPTFRYLGTYSQPVQTP
jgi:hypothetical protein